MVHQRLIIWHKDDIMENIEADQSCYRVDDRGSKRSFDQHLVNIILCDDEAGSYISVKTGRVLNLDPDYGFIWDNQEDTRSEIGIPPTGWPTVDKDDC